MFLTTAPYSHDKIEYLNNTSIQFKKEIEANPLLAKYMDAFLSKEVFPLKEEELWNDVKKFGPFNGEKEIAEYHYNSLKNEIIHHNLKVIEEYYSRITITRLAELCNTTEEKVEQ